MTEIEVEKLVFVFPEGARVVKYDDWQYYRNHFIKITQGVKGVDLAYVDAGKCCWLIEAKDYRHHARTKAGTLVEECVGKVRNTLAGLLAAATSTDANQPERDFARQVVRCERMRVVLHLEQPTQGRKGLPRRNRADVQNELKDRIKAVDRHPLVLESTSSHIVPWTVRPT